MTQTTLTTCTTFAQDLQEMMSAWNTIMAAAKAEFPSATEEELFQLASSAMRHSLGME
jgi:hypothetical protein